MRPLSVPQRDLAQTAPREMSIHERPSSETPLRPGSRPAADSFADRVSFHARCPAPSREPGLSCVSWTGASSTITHNNDVIAHRAGLRYDFGGLRMLGRWAFSGESRRRPFDLNFMGSRSKYPWFRCGRCDATPNALVARDGLRMSRAQGWALSQSEPSVSCPIFWCNCTMTFSLSSLAICPRSNSTGSRSRTIPFPVRHEHRVDSYSRSICAVVLCRINAH